MVNTRAEVSLEEKIISTLSNRILSISQLAKEIGVKRYILTGYLQALKNQGKLEFHKVGRSSVYTVKRWKK